MQMDKFDPVLATYWFLKNFLSQRELVQKPAKSRDATAE